MVMKDVSQILLTNSGCDRTVEGVAVGTFAAEATLDLSQVGRLLLPDGTKLTVPAVTR